MKISNSYICRDLFNYINIIPALQLIQYNKKLQNRLKIDKKVYESNSNCKITKKELYEKLKYEDNDSGIFLNFTVLYFIIYSLFNTENPILFIITKILFVFILFILIYIIYDKGLKINQFFWFKFVIYLVFIGILLVIINILKLKYIFPIISFRMLKKIIFFLFLIILFYICVLFFVNEYLYGSELETAKKFIIKLIIFIHSVYEILVALKINVLEKKNLNIIFDYAFLFINLYHIDYFIYLLKTYSTKENKIKRKSITRYFITRFKNIRICEYLLPTEFENIHNKIHYLNSISNTFKLENVSYNDQYYFLINNFREKNNVQELLFDNNFPVFIINGPFFLLSSEKNIFEIEETKYIFRFKNEFNINENNRKILLKNNLNRISFFKQGDDKYIFIFESKERHSINNYQEEYHQLFKEYSEYDYTYEEYHITG